MPGRAKPKKLNADELWEYALRSLGRRAQSLGEIRRKLATRAENSADIGPTLAKLREYGIADDNRFSEAYAASRVNNQSFGPQRVERELRTRKVTESVAQSAVAKAYAETDERAVIETYLQRKFRNKNLSELLSHPKQKASIYRRLRTAGFSSTESLNAMKRHATAMEDWPEPDEVE